MKSILNIIIENLGVQEHKLKILHITDTHQNFPKDLPEADVLIHTGDYSFINKYADLILMGKELTEFNNYLGSIKHKYGTILFTPGNHDFIFEKHLEIAKDLLTNATLLLNSGTEIDGVKFYGTPSQPVFCNWAFNHLDRDRKFFYGAIPDDTDVLLTHCPPYEILDLVGRSYSKGQNVGCPILLERVNEVKPKLHCFGHIHEQEVGIQIEEHTTFSNACIMDDSYEPNGTYNLIEVEKA